MASKWLDVRSVDEAAAIIAEGPCICDGMRFVRIPNMPIAHPLFGKAVPCACKTNELKRTRAEALQRASRLTVDMRERFSFSGFDPTFAVVPKGSIESEVRDIMKLALERCQEWARRPAGWLVLSGMRGSGKTHLAIAVASAQLQAGRPVYYNTATGMLEHLRASYESNAHDQYVRDMKAIDVLVIDDLGAERQTDWTVEQLTDILDSRHLERKPMLITTNAAPGDATIPDRIASRMREGAGVAGGFVTELVLPAGDARPKVPWYRQTPA